MARLSQLHHISGTENAVRKADVIFVHGLGGDAFDTWRPSKNHENFWPAWIGNDFPEVGVWSLAYAASPTKWSRLKGIFSKNVRDSGYAMSLPDRARQVLDLLGHHGIGKRPIMFICHSLGGLLVKQVLRMSSDIIEESIERNVFGNTRAVLFLATPHQGAELASLLKPFKIAFPTLAIDDLRAHDAHLRDLFEWYRTHSSFKVQTRTYFESRRVHNALLIVNPTSAHPGVGERPVPLDEDHISIAKPLVRTSQVYIAACAMLREHVLIPGADMRYQKDINALFRHSRAIKEDLTELSRIRIGDSEVKITRNCVQEIRDHVEKQSLVIVGDPGTGKSGVLHDLVTILLQEGRDTVFLAVDRIVSETEPQLRDQLKLEHDLDEILEKWNGDKPAFLVIDALDAARSDKVAHMLTNLLTRVIRNKGRWRVVTSIRKFDLRHSRELRNVFYGIPPLNEYKDSELLNVCHVQVPDFTEKELAEVAIKSDKFKMFFEVADYKLKQLLQVPFNLRLMGELLGEGVSVQELTPIRTQIELLDRYWEERVILPHDGQRDARENILQLAVSQMIESRTLRVPRTQVVMPSTSRALDQILSEHVLIEWQPSPNSRPDDSNLTFAHHVLFDYAVERLMFRGYDLIQMLASDSDLVLVARPSLDMHFQKIWSLDESRLIFWELVFKVVKAKQIREVGKLIGPVIAAESCSKLQDLHPVIKAIETPSGEDIAEAVLQHVIRSLLAMKPEDRVTRLVGKSAGPWIELVEHLSLLQNSRSTANIVCMLLIELREHFEIMTDEQQKQVGVASRNILELSWSQDPNNEWLVKQAITCVCQTYQSNSDESSVLLRRIFQNEHLVRYGYKDIPILAHEARNIITCDPVFVRDLFIAAFTHIESSEDKTQIGGSRILSFTSNRRQDYDGGLYQLGEDFEYFIEEAPIEAIEALIIVVESNFRTKHNDYMSDILEEKFLFDRKDAFIRTDYSSIWDLKDHHYDELHKMLDVFQEYFTRIGMDPNKIKLRNQLMNLLIERNRMAALWRRVLICGANAPTTLGLEVRFLAFSLPVLKCEDTSTVVGEFLQAVYIYLSNEEREKVEKVILSIPSTIDSAYAERLRDRLLGCLPTQHVYTNEARKRISELVIAGGVPQNSPLFGLNVREPHEDIDRAYLAREGVPVDDFANRRVQDLELNLKEFIDECRNRLPSLEEIKTIHTILRELWEALQKAEVDGVHPKQSDHAWISLSKACALSTRCSQLESNDDLRAFLLTVLLDAAKHPEPRVNPKYDHQFGEKTPSWSVTPRVEAAAGLINLARLSSSSVTPELFESLESLINDPVPSVRYQVVVSLLNLHEASNTIMWKLIDGVVLKETNLGVLNGLVHYVFANLTSEYPDKINDLSHELFDRTTSGIPLRQACVVIFKELYIWHDHRSSEEMIQSFIEDPLSYSEECHTLVTGLRETLTLGLAKLEEKDQVSIRRRTWDILLKLLQRANDQWRLLLFQSQAESGWSEELQQQARRLIQVIETAGMEVFLSSGAHENKRALGDSNRNKPNPDVQRLFFEEADKVLDALAKFSIARVTHHLLKTLEYLVQVDPVEVFLRIGRTISAGQEGGYQYESMAVDLVVNLVERYLAEFRGIFRDNPECRRTLLEMLDVFVQVGWLKAHRITYRFNEIFR